MSTRKLILENKVIMNEIMKFCDPITQLKLFEDKLFMNVWNNYYEFSKDIYIYTKFSFGLILDMLYINGFDNGDELSYLFEFKHRNYGIDMFGNEIFEMEEHEKI